MVSFISLKNKHHWTKEPVKNYGLIVSVLQFHYQIANRTTIAV
jgi:hypothetical protein